MRSIAAVGRFVVLVCVLLGPGWNTASLAQDVADPPAEEPVEEVAGEAMLAGAAPDGAQEAGDGAGEGEDDEATAGGLDYTLVQLVGFGGVVGYLIIALSFVAVALMVDDALLLRRKVLMPPQEVEELRQLVERSADDEVIAGDRSSFVGAMTVAGVRERSHGYEAVVKAMEDCGDGLTGRLLRRIEYLNIIANITPMLGLLGTVIGMVSCFNQISVATGGVDPRLLASGIFQALMTTVMGLIVAIPTLFAFSMFRNRVDALAAEATQRAEEIVAPLRPPGQHGSPAARLSRVSS